MVHEDTPVAGRIDFHRKGKREAQWTRANLVAMHVGRNPVESRPCLCTWSLNHPGCLHQRSPQVAGDVRVIR